MDNFNLLEILKYKEIMETMIAEPESANVKLQIDVIIDNLDFAEREILFMFIPVKTLRGIAYNLKQKDLDKIYMAFAKALAVRNELDKRRR